MVALPHRPKEKVYKHKDDGDRVNKLCKCKACKKVSRCSWGNDFYTEIDGDGFLLCEKCFRKRLRDQGFNVSFKERT